MSNWNRSLKLAARRVLPACAVVGILASAEGAADLTTLVSGRTWLLQGRDTYKLDGRTAAPDAVYDTDGLFRATFMEDRGLELDNRPFGIIPGTWTPGAGRELKLAVTGLFPVVYDSFLRSLILEELRRRTELPLVLDEDVFIAPGQGEITALGLTARVSRKGLQLTLILRNKRTYRVIVTDPGTGRRRTLRGVFRQLGRFEGPLVQ